MWLSVQFRVLSVVVGCGVLWSLESLLPLYRYEEHRWRRAWPNVALTILLIVTNLALSFVMAGISQFASTYRFGLFQLVSMPSFAIGFLGVMALDLFTYFAHVLLHKSFVGWRFHRVHHTDYEVNVTTAFRFHPGETVWRILWYALAILTFGLPIWVLLVYLTISALNGQLEHANIRLEERLDRVFRLLIVTPNMHKVHHSRMQIQTDSNYGNILSVWDRLFGSYTPAIDFNRLRYGLAGFDSRDTQTLPALLRLPFLP